MHPDVEDHAALHLVVTPGRDHHSIAATNPKLAAQSFDQVSAALKRQGFSQRQINAAFNDYTIAAKTADTQTRLNAQGTDTVASMVVWENGRMRKSDYRKFIIRGAWGNDDFASMREAVERRYRRVQSEQREMPGLILIDGGLGQLRAAAQALEQLEIINQPVAAIAKQEEVLFVLGQEDEPIRLERHSPLLHLIQQIRDDTHRFAVGFHRQRRSRRTLKTELDEIPGVGSRTVQKLLREFGSVARVRLASAEDLSRVVSRPVAVRIAEHLHGNHVSSAAPKADPAA